MDTNKLVWNLYLYKWLRRFIYKYIFVNFIIVKKNKYR